MVIPLFVGRERSIQALQQSMEQDKRILLVAQVDAGQDNPAVEEIYRVGTVATILQLLKLPDGTVKVLVEGGQRARIDEFEEGETFLSASITVLDPGPEDGREIEALTRSLLAHFEQYVKLNKKTPPEILASLSNIEDAARLADTVAAHLGVKIEQKQAILEIHDTRERLEHLVARVEEEIDLLQVEKRIRGRVKRQMEKSQREYYLNEQMKAIQKELGDMDEAPNEIEDLAKRIESAGMSKEARTKATAELNKLKMMSPMSAEATVVRNYVDWLANVPWKKRTRIGRDLGKAEAVLEADHYGLEKVKERIVEYLAVQTRVKKLKGPILCLVGAPGVGKTSLGQSIARATNRKFVRMSLGGVRDEAEIRGHRRTYIGSMPGKIVQGMKKAKSSNPLFLLDEVDKLGADWRGDPSSALLEVLDPEQNGTFNDHYLEVDYDLSDVMFITTANTLRLPQPLLDRMEVIRIPGYTEDEKVEIARRHLIDKQLAAHGLKSGEWTISDGALRDLIRYYTREAGVRNLERELANLQRKAVKALATSEAGAIEIENDNLETYAGVRKFRFGQTELEDLVGVTTGLAWTEVGGEILSVEAVVMPGKGNVKHTGKLGDVMQESVEAARSFVRSRMLRFGIAPPEFDRRDIHVHVPEGATPKDGPSAGVAMCASIVSALTGIPIRRHVAMTGEITLRGRVLPIGGLKEKLLAALRAGITTVLIPEENMKDLAEIPDNVKNSLEIVPVETVDEVLGRALTDIPTPIDWQPPEAAETPPPAVEGATFGGMVTH
jgi:ATP-dependent Lon protease